MVVRRGAGRIRPDRGFPYNGAVGEWWKDRAADRAHMRAYVTIADFIRNSLHREPRWILDYACGAGQLLSLLSRRFPRSRLIGLDGSSLLLGLAEKRLSRLPVHCARRISLIETSLPGSLSLRRRADLVTFCFPNMMPSRAVGKTKGPGSRLGERDLEIAKSLSRLRESTNRGRDDASPQSLRRTLEYARSLSKNLRSLMVRGGICVRAEYATTKRHEWSPLELERVCFEEGSLETTVEGTHLQPWFRVLASAYFRSRVLEDVYQQTGDSRDKAGGYLVTILQAL